MHRVRRLETEESSKEKSLKSLKPFKPRDLLKSPYGFNDFNGGCNDPPFAAYIHERRMQAQWLA
jgi:hypothetical protein